MIHNGNIFDCLKMIYSGIKFDGKCKIWDFNPLLNSLPHPVPLFDGK
jgi:hypothetical protein